jgi:hypothetical protein
MNRKANIVRMLVASSGVVFGMSALIKEWTLSIPAIVLLIFAIIYALVGTTQDTSEKRLQELLINDDKGKDIG